MTGDPWRRAEDDFQVSDLGGREDHGASPMKRGDCGGRGGRCDKLAFGYMKSMSPPRGWGGGEMEGAHERSVHALGQGAEKEIMVGPALGPF